MFEFEDVQLFFERSLDGNTSQEIPRDHAADDQKRRIPESRVLKPDGFGRVADGQGLRRAERRNANDPGRDKLHEADAEVADTRLHAECGALHVLRKKEACAGHIGGEVAAAKARRECQNHEHPERRVRIHHCQTDADARYQFQDRCVGDNVPCAVDGYQKHVDNAERPTCQTWHCRQPK